MKSVACPNLLGCLAALLSSAATAGEKAYVPVPPTAMHAEVKTSCVPEEATITVKRDHGFKGSGIHSDLVVDGKPIAELRPGQTVTFCLPADEHIVGVTWSMLGGFSNNKREIAAEIRAGKNYFFRIFILHAQGATIERTAE
ncbi:hypothetical protein [Cognatilysobacter lacus]|uniref:Uncharacterized protein n=1 Tax=Cognatilysobacter lacus TaxID=1643323 RepID=A0A5D8Z9J0_9GAMM|nr:hypothetical protein [Lysobacter lacus]TZF90723.1 hypothetical protein FW784_04270 [Lysobacter lacus]